MWGEDENANRIVDKLGGEKGRPYEPAAAADLAAKGYQTLAQTRDSGGDLSGLPTTEWSDLKRW